MVCTASEPQFVSPMLERNTIYFDDEIRSACFENRQIGMGQMALRLER